MMYTEIMIVEDEILVAMDIQNRLEKLGYTVTALASSGSEAILKAGEIQPDLVLMDILLKGDMDGVETAKHIRARFDIPVVYLTAYSDEITVDRAKITEPFGYLLKPLEERELYTSIEIALYKHKMERNLRESQQWLTTTLRSIGDAVIATDTKGFITFMNPVAEALTGWRHEDATGRNLGEVFKITDGQILTMIERPSVKVLQEGVVVNGATGSILISKTEREIHIDINIAPIREEGRDTLGFILVFRDVTDRKRAEEALQRSEERYRTLYEYNPSMYFTLDTEGNILSVNRFGAEQLGYTSEELLGQRVLKVFYEDDKKDDKKAVLDQLSLCLQNPGQIFRCESRKVRKDGSMLWVRESACTAQDVNGDTVVLITCQDITDGKKAEEALRESEERFRSLVENVSDIVTVIDNKGTVCYITPSVKKILGYMEQELMGRNILDYIHPDDLIRYSDKLGDAVRNPGTNIAAELRFLHHDGHWRILETVGKTLYDDSGGLRSIVIARDITKRKKAEERVREQATLLDKAQDAIIVRDLENRIIYWNKSAERLYGWTADQALYKNANEILHNERSPHLTEAQKSVLEKGEWVGELQQVTGRDREVIVESRWTLVNDEDGKPKSILTINTDVTEKKRLEAQLLRAQRMDSIGTLAGGIAHDLNNILTPVMIGLGLLKGRFIDTYSRNILDTLELSIQRGADLVKQVLSFTRGLEGERNELQVKYLISEISKIVEQTFPKSIKLRTNIPKDPWLIRGDITQLHQVLMNLCVNARDAMPHGGMLDISAENLFIDENYVKMDVDAKIGLYIVITVSDTGTGIPPNIMDRMFEPFFTTKEPGKGTGLGLSTAFGIVKSHGGFIHVYSEEGKGTRFKIYLPAVGTKETQKAGERQDQGLASGSGELILVVDDEVFIRDMVRATLESEGYRVITVSNGKEAIKLYKEYGEEIKVVLMDLMMPVMDGPLSIRELRAIDPTVKIIVTSGLIEKDKLAEISSVDVQTFLFKPYTPETLLKSLHGVLSMNHKNPNGDASD